MDNSRQDIFSVFRDDPELLALLADQAPEAMPETVTPPPPQPVTDFDSFTFAYDMGEFSDLPADIETSAPAPDESKWREMMDALDLLLATASDPPTPVLPPRSTYSTNDLQTENLDSFFFQDPFVPPPNDPPDWVTQDSEDPLVIGDAVSFDLGDLMGTPATPSRSVPPFPFALEETDAASQADDTPPPKQLTESPEKPRSRRRRIASILFNIVFGLLCVTLVVGSLIFAFSDDQEKSYFGFRFFNVLSDSMRPEPGDPPGGFSADDIVIVKVVKPENAREEIKEGDVITIRTSDERTTADGKREVVYLSHRVVDILEEYEGVEDLFLVARGDRNEADDPPVPVERLVGKVVLVLPSMGPILDYVKNNWVLVIVFIVALITFAILLRSLLSSGKKKRGKKKRQAGKTAAAT